MSHIAEVYAKDLGVKVGKPNIQDHFFPTIYDKYITLHVDTEIQSKQYDYWDICISLLKEHLGEEIKIIQIGGKEAQPIPGIDHSIIGCHYRQTNYIIKKSLLHLGIDSLPVHVSSVYNKPVVALYSHTYKETCYPYWTDKEKTKLLSPDFSEIKPSFSTQEVVKRINEIKPEIIAQSVLDLLGIDKKVKFKTIRIGKNFQNNSVEVKPDFFAYSRELHGGSINLRADLHFDFNHIVNWSQMCALNLILTTALTNEQLDLIKRNTKQIMFRVNDIENDYTEFFKYIKKNKINLIVSTKNKDILNELRFKYFDFNVELEAEHAEISNLVNENTKYFSKKHVITQSKSFKSNFSADLLDNSNKFVLNDVSKQELETLYLYE